MDFINGLPLSDGKLVSLVVVHQFPKYSHFIPLSYPYIAITVARLFFDNILKLHGFPKTIMMEHNVTFTRALCLSLVGLS